jgi:D-alanyl-D-alanine carboxypeptidase (penicillin-binding protein 5/6)
MRMFRRLLPVLLLATLLGSAGGASAQPSVETVARQAILLDYDTGATLFAKNADDPMPPSSMSKLMTAVMVFDRLAAGTLKLDDTFTVSERAWRMSLNEGSAMFLTLNDKVKIEDLLRGMIIQSGNDACVALAEGLAGSEQRFAELMTQKGREIGLQKSVFKNSSGWPEPDHVMTARDLATLASHIIRTYPQYYHFYSEKEFTYGVDIKTKKPIRQGNRNPLLYRDTGADGLKTGHTASAGYGLTASAKRGDRRLVMVLNGMASVRERDRESERLLDIGFREWENVKIASAGATVETADVWLGTQKTVALQTERDTVITLPRKNRPGLKAVITYDSPIPAPLRKGMPVARILVTAPEMTPVEIPLLASADVERLGFGGRIGAALSHLVFGKSGK